MFLEIGMSCPECLTVAQYLLRCAIELFGVLFAIRFVEFIVGGEDVLNSAGSLRLLQTDGIHQHVLVGHCKAASLQLSESSLGHCQLFQDFERPMVLGIEG